MELDITYPYNGQPYRMHKPELEPHNLVLAREPMTIDMWYSNSACTELHKLSVKTVVSETATAYMHKVSATNVETGLTRTWQFNRTKFDITLEYGEWDIYVEELDSVEELAMYKRVWALERTPSLFYKPQSSGGSLLQMYKMAAEFQQVRIAKAGSILSNMKQCVSPAKSASSDVAWLIGAMVLRTVDGAILSTVPTGTSSTKHKIT